MKTLENKKPVISKEEKEMIIMIEEYLGGLTRFDVENHKAMGFLKNINNTKTLAKLIKKGLVAVKAHERNYKDCDIITRKYHRKFDENNYIIK